MAKGAQMAVGTIISRITGLLRDMAMTAALGLGIVADIFTVGNTIPNTVYVLTVGGAMNAVFVPQLVRRMRSDSDGGAGFADRLLTLTIVALVVADGRSPCSLAPLLTRIYASPEYTDEQMSPGRRVHPLLPAPGLLLRAVHPAVPGAQRPGPLLPADVRPDRQQHRGDRGVPVLPRRSPDRPRRQAGR